MPLGWAAEIATGNPDLTMRWDNTLKYSAAWRMHNPSSILTANRNLNDGDANFKRGMISNRLDLFSEFDLTYKQMGMRLSAAAWYDDIYNKRNDHPNDGTANQLSVPYNAFTDKTRSIHGRKAELPTPLFSASSTLTTSRPRCGSAGTRRFGANHCSSATTPLPAA